MTTYSYDRAGNQVLMVDPLGRSTQSQYDSRSRLISTTLPDGSIQTQRYDTDNNQTSTVDANGNRINLVYDARGRLTRRIEQRPNQPELVTTFEYDAANQQTAIIDANNHRTEYRYNDLGQRITVIDAPSTPISSTTRTEYDLVGNVTKEIDGLGNQTQTVYDHRDRVIRVISPTDPSTPQGTTITRYDGVGNIIELTDPVGNKTTYTYDPRNRLKTDTNQLNFTRTYVYDAASNRTQVTDRNGRIRTFTYDTLNRQTAENWLNGTGGVIRTTSFVYDAADQLVRVSDPDSSYDFSYDLLGRRVGVDNIGTPGAPRVVLGYSYDREGNVIGVSDRINGTARAVTNYTYDPLNRLTQITQSGTGVATKRVNFDYDNLGQYKTINRYSDLAGTQLVVGTNYTYDGKNRLDVLSHNRGGSALALYDFDYDNADRITRINSLVDGVTNYTYDNQNQLRVADHNLAANPDESYTYDANGNRISTTGSRGNRSYTTPALSDNRLQSDGVFSYQYDNEGNLVRRTEISTGKVIEYTWDYVNRLVGVTDRNSVGGAAVRNVGFSYDVMGRRISKSVDNNPNDTIEGAVTYFVYDRDDVILDFVDSDGRSGVNAPVQSRRYLFGNNTDQILSQEDGSGANVNWTLTDHLGTVKDLVNNSGAVVNHFTYDSFGNVVSQSNAAVDTRYRFTGREFDGETGLYYYRARYYDSQVGRFIGTDPIGFDGRDANLYQYGKNNPVDTTDPLGLWGWVRNQSRQIFYEDNGTKYANHRRDVQEAFWQNPRLSIRSDVTLAFISHLFWKTGTETRPNVTPPHFIRGIDNRGHIVGSQLGGKGDDINNLFSQNQLLNQFWKTHENNVRKYLDAANTVPVCPPPSVDLNYIVSLQYEPGSLRPSAYLGRAVFTNGHNIFSETFSNPRR